MVNEPGEPPFTTTVESGFAVDGVWCIRATLRFRDGAPLPGSKILGEARLALLVEIMKAGRRGRELGADTCRVHLDTGDRVVEFALGEDLPDLLSPN